MFSVIIYPIPKQTIAECHELVMVFQPLYVKASEIKVFDRVMSTTQEYSFFSETKVFRFANSLQVISITESTLVKEIMLSESKR